MPATLDMQADHVALVQACWLTVCWAEVSAAQLGLPVPAASARRPFKLICGSGEKQQIWNSHALWQVCILAACGASSVRFTAEVRLGAMKAAVMRAQPDRNLPHGQHVMLSTA